MSYNIRKIAQLLDERENAWSDIYETAGIGDTTINAQVPRENREPSLIRKALLRAGGVLPSLDDCRGEINRASEADAQVVRRAGRTGWRDNRTSFVGHQYVEGVPEGSVLPPLKNTNGAAGEISTSGTLAEWKKLIDIARHSTAMLVALCAAFAAVFLSLLQRPNFGLVLVGPSRSGKSTAQLVAASVIGFGEEEHLPTLSATSSGLLEMGLIFNDHMLPINEVGTARGPKKDIHNALADMTYSLMTGKDTIRHSSWGGDLGSSSSFKVLPLLSSERSPDEWAARGGETREVGETARLIGVPVLSGGHTTVFDRPPETDKDPTEWDAEQFEILRSGLPQHHGEAGRAYHKALVANLAEYISNAEEDLRDFVDGMAKHALTPIKRDIVAKFGVLYAGGRAAADVGILPFNDKLLLSANRRACRAALATLPDPDADLRADALKLIALLQSEGMIDADEASNSAKKLMHQADGFHMKDRLGVRYVLRSTKFTSICPSAPRTRRLLERLDEKGFLQRQRDYKTGASNEWAQTQVTWPDSTRTRSICIFIPGGNLDVLDFDA